MAMQACAPNTPARPGIRSCDSDRALSSAAERATPLASSEATAHEPFDALQMILKTRFMSFLPLVEAAETANEYFRM